jgi:hypothetical protein
MFFCELVVGEWPFGKALRTPFLGPWFGAGFGGRLGAGWLGEIILEGERDRLFCW